MNQRYKRLRRQRSAYGRYQRKHSMGIDWWGLAGLAVLVVALLYAVTCTIGCASASRLEKLAVELSAFRGEVNATIGGGVDTITTVGAVAGLVVMALSYPLGRYLRHKLRARRDRVKATTKG